MAEQPSLLHLSFEEAISVGADLRRVWVGMTGNNDIPSEEAAADIVQRCLRKSREIVANRESAE